ncbi:nucleoside deaminase [Geminicoccus harenae]|uniref:nucleoside deaminase n=1 Tax=Geminicoccus harenae TaxID=2498453 RepID=UPI001CC2B678|nr:nucleoside deaminase [Geminicoccus harenae]
MNHETAMRRAIRLSIEKMEAGEGGPFGAVIVKDGEIIAEGWNRVTSTNDPTAHAEMEAIRAACRKLGSHSLEGATIYTSCEPCPMCFAAIYWARLDAAHYGNDHKAAGAIGFDDEFLYRELAVPMDQRRVRFTCTLPDEAKEGFDRWIAKADKVAY